MNQFQAAGGPGFVHPRAARRRLPARRRRRPSPPAACAAYTQVPQRDGGRLRLGGAARGQRRRRRSCARRRGPSATSGGLKLLDRQPRPRGDQGLGGARRPPRRSRRRRASSTRQEALLAAFKAGELERDFVVVVRFQGPRANGMPELHKLTPPLAVLQEQGLPRRAGHRRPHERRLGQGAGGDPRQPRGRSAGGPLGKVRDGDVIRLDADAGTLEALVDAGRVGGARAGDARRRRRPRPTPTASAASSSPACAATSSAPRKAPAPGCEPIRAGCSSTLELAAYGPVIPVIVIERVEDAVPLARALVDGGVRVLEVTLRTPVALACIEAIARAVPEAIVGAGTLRSAADAQAGPGRRRTLRRQPGLHRRRRRGLPRHSACRCCPAWPPASEVMQAHGRRLSLPEVLPRHGGRRHRRC